MTPFYDHNLELWLVRNSYYRPFTLADWFRLRKVSGWYMEDYQGLNTLGAIVYDGTKVNKNGVISINWKLRNAIGFKSEEDALNFISIISDPNLVKLL